MTHDFPFRECSFQVLNNDFFVIMNANLARPFFAIEFARFDLNRFDGLRSGDNYISTVQSRLGLEFHMIIIT